MEVYLVLLHAHCHWPLMPHAVASPAGVLRASACTFPVTGSLLLLKEEKPEPSAISFGYPRLLDCAVIAQIPSQGNGIGPGEWSVTQSGNIEIWRARILCQASKSPRDPT